MIRANIKSSDEVYIGLINEDDDGFTIVWNKNISSYTEPGCAVSNRYFHTYAEACENVYTVMADAKISETIYYRPSKSGN